MEIDIHPNMNFPMRTNRGHYWQMIGSFDSNSGDIIGHLGIGLSFDLEITQNNRII